MPPPPPLPPDAGQLHVMAADTPDAAPRAGSKRRIAQLLSTSGVGLVLLGGGIWFARVPLAEAGIEAVLAGRGVPATVDISGLSLSGLTLGRVQLGKGRASHGADRPEPVGLESARLSWRREPGGSRWFLSVTEVRGMTAGVVIRDGVVDFGSLAPLLERRDAGPSPVFIEKLDVADARVSARLFTGESISQSLILTGDLTGAQDAFIVRGLIAVAGPLASSRAPIPVGLGLRQPGARSGRSGPLALALDARPAGLDLNRGPGGRAAMAATGISGRLLGVLQAPAEGPVQIDVRDSSLQIAQADIAGVEASQTRIDIGSARWRPGKDWRRDSTGRLEARLRAGKIATAGTRLDGVDLRLTGERKADGAVVLSLGGRASGGFVPGGVVASFGGLSLAASGALMMADLGLPAAATGAVDFKLAGDGIRLDPRLLASIPAPFASLASAPLRLGADGTLLVWPDQITVALSQLASLSGPGGQLRLTPEPGRQSALLLSRNSAIDDAVWVPEVDLAGRLDGTLAGGGTLEAGLQSVRWRDGSLAVSVASGRWQDVATAGLRTSGVLERGAVTLGPEGLTAQGQGQVSASGRLAAGTQVEGLNARYRVALADGILEADVTGQAGLLAVAGYRLQQTSVQLAVTGGQRQRLSGQASARAARVDGSSGAGRALALDARFDGRSAGFDAPLATTFTARADSVSAAGTTLAGVTMAGAGDLRILSQTGFAGRAQVRALRTESAAASTGQIDLAGPLTMGFAGGAVDARFALTGEARQLQAGQTRARVASLSADGRLQARAGRVTGTVSARMQASGIAQSDVRIARASTRGRFGVSTGSGGLAVRSLDGCLPVEFGALVAGGVSSAGARVDVCPEGQAPLLALGPRGLRLGVRAQGAPMELQLPVSPGLPEGLAPTLRLGPVRLSTVEGPGGQSYALTSDSLIYQLPVLAQTGPVTSEATPAPRLATLKSSDARIVIGLTPGGAVLTGTLAGLSSDGLPVSVSGTATADLRAGPNGLAGDLVLDAITLSDPQADPMFGTFLLNGTGTLAPDGVQLSGTLTETRTGAPVARLTLGHVFATGTGGLTATLDRLAFNPRFTSGVGQGLQPYDLSPRLRGLIVDARGAADGSLTAAWQPGAALSTGASLVLGGLSFATQAGPVGGLSGTITLNDLIALSTPGIQTLTIGGFNPGVPILGGSVDFRLPGNGSLVVERGQWPFAGGQLSLEPFSFVFAEPAQNFNVRLDRVNLDQFLRLTEIKDIEITGTASGVFPIHLENAVVEIRNGVLEVDTNGGGLRYTGADPSPPPPPQTWWQRLTRQPPPPPQGLGLAIAALRNLDYRVLRVTVDGRLTGDITVGMALEGSNDDVLNGAPFRFRMNANVPFGRLMSLRRYLDPQFYWDMTRTAPVAPQAPAPLPPTGAALPPPPDAAPPPPGTSGR